MNARDAVQFLYKIDAVVHDEEVIEVSSEQSKLRLCRMYKIFNLIFIYDINIHRNIAMNNFHHMGLAKTEQFTAEENRMASIAKALAHPARIAILKVLIQKKACICGDIVDELPLSQSTVSQHLKELKEARLIKGDIEGVKVCYCIDGDNWAAAQSLLQEFFESKVITNTKCC